MKRYVVSIVLALAILAMLTGSAFAAGYITRDHSISHCHVEHDDGSPDPLSVYCDRPIPFRSYAKKEVNQ